jgi:hypothetical protein
VSGCRDVSRKTKTPTLVFSSFMEDALGHGGINDAASVAAGEVEAEKVSRGHRWTVRRPVSNLGGSENCRWRQKGQRAVGCAGVHSGEHNKIRPTEVLSGRRKKTGI